MSTTKQDIKSTIPSLISLLDHNVSNPPVSTPYIPSDVEATNYYYGLPSKPRFIARSSPDIWVKPTGAEAYLEPKELTPLGTHILNVIWEETVGPAMDLYLQGKGVQNTSMNPLRIGIAGQSFPPAVIFVGVNPGSLSPELGIEVAVHCRSILVQNGIDDVHVEICESQFIRTGLMYKPVISANPTLIVHEPFSTSLGLPICNAKTTNIEGTGGIFFIDSAKPHILYLLTARHILFHPDKEENELYQFHDGTGAPRRNVILLGKATFKARLKDIEDAISAKKCIIDQLDRRSALTDKMEDKDNTTMERKAVDLEMCEANEAIKVFKKLLVDVMRDWEEEENRVIGHIILSPPISLDYGDDGFTDDWAVVQMHPTKISRLNFIGNAIDLGSVKVDELTAWMYPHPNNPSTFKYPGDRLLRCFGTVPDQEMFRPNPRNKDHDDDPVIMVLKNGNTSKLTVGRLNTIRAFVREYFNDVAGKMSKEVSILPRNSKSGPFSARGDSGSVVIDANGRICGIVTGGDGATDVSDCTFVTSINFLVKRLAAFGIKANLFPLPTDL